MELAPAVLRQLQTPIETYEQKKWPLQQARGVHSPGIKSADLKHKGTHLSFCSFENRLQIIGKNLLPRQTIRGKTNSETRRPRARRAHLLESGWNEIQFRSSGRGCVPFAGPGGWRTLPFPSGENTRKSRRDEPPGRLPRVSGARRLTLSCAVAAR